MKVIIGNPRVLNSSLEFNITPKVRYLAEELGLGRDGAAKVITRAPNVLGLSIENCIAPKVMYLEEELGLGRAGAVKVIIGRPSVLNMSVEDNIAPKVKFLAEEAGFGCENSPDTNASMLVSVASYSLAGRLVPRVRLLRKHGQAGRFAASGIGQLTNDTFCEKVGITMEENDAEVAACVREHAEKRLGPEGGAGAGGEGEVGGGGAGAGEIDG